MSRVPAHKSNSIVTLTASSPPISCVAAQRLEPQRRPTRLASTSRAAHSSVSLPSLARDAQASSRSVSSPSTAYSPGTVTQPTTAKHRAAQGMATHHQPHYGHRSIVTQPVGGAAQSPPRIAELLEFVKQEFDNIQADSLHSKAQTTEFEGRINGHLGDLVQLREQYYALQREHTQTKTRYEGEIASLRQQLADNRTGGPHDARTSAPSGPPPSVGHGSSNLFGGIINPGSGAATHAGGHNSGSGGTYSSGGPRPDLINGGAAGRERDPAFSNGASGLRGDNSEHPNKRIRQEREREEDVGHPASHRDGNASPGPPPLRNDARGKNRNGEINQSSRTFNKNSQTSSPHPFNPINPSYTARDGHLNNQLTGPTSAPGSAALPPGPISTSSQQVVSSGTPAPPLSPSNNANHLLDLDPDSLPSTLKKEGADWMTMFNPKVRKVLDVGLVHTLVHDSVVCCVTFSPDGKILATGCNRSTTLYDTRTGAKICLLVDESAGTKADNYIRSASFSPDGKFLSTGSEDRMVRIWDIAKRRVRTVFKGHMSEIYSLAFSPDGRMLVSGSGDKTARIWDMESGTCLFHLMIEDVTLTDNGPMDGGVTSVSVSPDGTLLAAGSLDTVVRLWDTQTGQLLDKLKGHKDSVYSVAFSPDGTFLVSGSLDKTLKMWDLGTLDRKNRGEPTTLKKEDGENGEKVTTDRGFDSSRSTTLCTTTLSGHKDYVLSVAVSPDGAWIVSGSKDRGVQFWDPKTAMAQFMLQGHTNSVISIAVSAVSGLLATGSGDWNARIWQITELGSK